MSGATVTVTFNLERANLSGTVPGSPYSTELTLSGYGKLNGDTFTEIGADGYAGAAGDPAWHTCYIANSTSYHWDDAKFDTYDKYAVYKLTASIPATTADARAGYTVAKKTTISFSARTDDSHVAGPTGIWYNDSVSAIPNYGSLSKEWTLQTSELTNAAHTVDVGYVMMNVRGTQTTSDSIKVGIQMAASAWTNA